MGGENKDLNKPERFKTETQEWIEIRGDVASVGLSLQAKEAIGEIVGVQLPETGRKYVKGDEICVLESAKSAFDLYAPLSGQVVQVNTSLGINTDLINKDPEKDGWLYKLKIQEKGELDKLKKC